MDVLLCSRFNSSKGIKLSLDKPMNVHTLLNINHPAVLQQYFGVKFDDLSNVMPGIEYRFTYGSGTGISSVRMDRSKFVTHPFTLSLHIIARELHKTRDTFSPPPIVLYQFIPSSLPLLRHFDNGAFLPFLIPILDRKQH